MSEHEKVHCFWEAMVDMQIYIEKGIVEQLKQHPKTFGGSDMKPVHHALRSFRTIQYMLSTESDTSAQRCFSITETGLKECINIMRIYNDTNMTLLDATKNLDISRIKTLDILSKEMNILRGYLSLEFDKLNAVSTTFISATNIMTGDVIKSNTTQNINAGKDVNAISSIKSDNNIQVNQGRSSGEDISQEDFDRDVAAILTALTNNSEDLRGEVDDIRQSIIEMFSMDVLNITEEDFSRIINKSSDSSLLSKWKKFSAVANDNAGDFLNGLAVNTVFQQFILPILLKA